MKNKTIRAYGKQNRVPKSLSNYIYGSQNGYQEARETFENIIEAQPFNGKKICDALNSTKNILRKFTVLSSNATVITLEATDYLGNKDIIRITEKHLEVGCK